MSDGKIRGVVHVIEETKTYGQKGFRKRLVVLEQDNGRFINYVPFEFTRDACDTADALKVGDESEIEFSINGRKWQRDASSEVKYFLNAEVDRFNVVGQTGADPNQALEPNSANDQFAEAGFDDEDVPF